jgi:hypothetical protein
MIAKGLALRCAILWVLLLILSDFPSMAGAYQQAFIKASNAGNDDSFGTSVGLSGDTLVIGAFWESGGSAGVNGDQTDNSVSKAGAAYVYVRNGKQWATQAYLKASNPDKTDLFGSSVAISGDTIVVGAPYEDSAAIGVNGDAFNNASGSAGAAYVFVRNGTNWTQQAYLKASNTALWGERFGTAVAIDGDTIVVGAILESSVGVGVNGEQTTRTADSYESGAAYVFVRGGTTWSQQAYLKASNPGKMDHFGAAVAVARDTIIVGAPQEASTSVGVNGDQTDNNTGFSGAAYIFARDGTVWSQQAYLKASNTHGGEYFGTSVAIHGETAVVGAPGEMSNATGVDGDQTDHSILSAGAAYVFVRRNNAWSQQAYLKASNTETAYFGTAVGIFSDSILVGAKAEVSASPGVNGDQTSVAAWHSGAAYSFLRNNATWRQNYYLKASNPGGQRTDLFPPEDGDLFGGAVAIYADTVAVGAFNEDSNSSGVNGAQNNLGHDTGAVYVFRAVAPAAITPKLQLPRRDGNNFIFEFTSDPYLDGWEVAGYPTLIGQSADLGPFTAISEVTPGHYRAEFSTSSKRYFLWLK